MRFTLKNIQKLEKTYNKFIQQAYSYVLQDTIIIPYLTTVYILCVYI